MKPINICIVVFNRYDLLKRLIESVSRSVVTPGRQVRIYIIDRGHNSSGITSALGDAEAMMVDLPGQSLSDAWNWFMLNVPEERILASDDIEFFPETIETFVNTPGDFVGLNDGGRSSPYACFLVRDTCIEKVGLFDNSLSPNYVYFEDCDHAWRMKLLGVSTIGISCMHHGLAQSWVKKTAEQQADHHPKFIAAEARYVKKWGGKPDQEVFKTPFDSGANLQIRPEQQEMFR